MKIGLSAMLTDTTMRPDDLAREAEDRGFESIWFSDHSYIPVEPHQGNAARPAAHLNTAFHSVMETLVTVATAAAATKKIKVATGMCLLAQRDPLTTAKALATIDILSRGRLIVGIGAGWHAAEMANHGTDFRTRSKTLRERVLAMKQIWSTDETEFHGDRVDFGRIFCKPKPVQQPGPPIIAGMDGSLGMERMIEWADGWCPSPYSLPDLAQKVAIVHEHLRAAGRDPAGFPISIFYNNGLANSDITQSDVDTMSKLGLERMVLNVPALPPAEILPILDKYTGLVQ